MTRDCRSLGGASGENNEHVDHENEPAGFMSCRAMLEDRLGTIAEAADLLHAPAAARTRVEAAVLGRSRLVSIVRGRGGADREQLAAKSEFLGTVTITEETVMADPMKTVRQGMQQKTPNELIGRQGHHLALIVVPIITPTEADLLARHVDQPAVCDGDAVRIATEIGQDRRGTGKGALGIDHPLGAPQFAEAAGEDWCSGETGQRAEERQSAGLEGGPQLLQEQSTEQARQHSHRQKEAGPTGNPTPAVRR